MLYTDVAKVLIDMINDSETEEQKNKLRAIHFHLTQLHNVTPVDALDTAVKVIRQ